MSETARNRAAVGQKAVRGGTALGIRQVLILGVNLVGAAVLSRLLGKEDFGLYSILSTLLSLGTVLCDPGLGASFIRQAQEPDEREYRSAWTLQQILSAFFVLVFFAAAPWIVSHYEQPDAQVRFFRFGVLFLLAVPFIQLGIQRLERRLEFGKVALVEILQTVTFQAVTVGCALSGMGVQSFCYGVLARGGMGILVLLWFRPWKLVPAWDGQALRKHLRFGLPYQGGGLLGALNASVNPALIGTLFGVAPAGLIGWATALLGYVQMPMFLLHRILFPTYSRLQEDEPGMLHALDESYAISSFLFFGVASLTGATAPLLIPVFFDPKWLEAVPYLDLFLAGNLFLPLAVVNGAVAYTLGWSGRVLGIGTVKLALFSALTFLLAGALHSPLAYGYAYLLAEGLHLWIYVLICRRFPGRRALRDQAPFFVSAIVVYVLLRRGFEGQSGVLSLMLALAVGTAAYGVLGIVMSNLSGRPILRRIQSVLHRVRPVTEAG